LESTTSWKNPVPDRSKKRTEAVATGRVSSTKKDTACRGLKALSKVKRKRNAKRRRRWGRRRRPVRKTLSNKPPRRGRKRISRDLKRKRRQPRARCRTGNKLSRGSKQPGKRRTRVELPHGEKKSCQTKQSPVGAKSPIAKKKGPERTGQAVSVREANHELNEREANAGTKRQRKKGAPW